MPLAQRIDCMECGGDAYLAQAVGPDDDFEAGDILTYICRDCAHRWDVVLDDEDLTDDD
jgi:hypothetical protein